MLRDVLGGRMLWGRRQIQMVDNLVEKNICTDLKKAAEDMSIWQTLRKDYHKPAK